MINLT